MKKFILILQLIGVLLLVFFPFIANAEKLDKQALLIGNSDYDNLTSLDNPSNDVVLIKNTLENLGFKVTILTNASNIEMGKAVDNFSDRLRSSKKGGVTLFYYAGHGVQGKTGSLLLPVDFNAKSRKRERYVALQDVLSDLDVGKDRNKIFILDACREDSALGGKKLSAGAEYVIPLDSLLAFSTQPGGVAQDGEGANSPYALSLVKFMKMAGLELKDVFQQTRNEVHFLTQSQQNPTETLNLRNSFYFVPGEKTRSFSNPEIVDSPKAENIAWIKIQNSGSLADYNKFLNLYPNGRNASKARKKKGKLIKLKDGDKFKSSLGVSLTLFNNADGTDNIRVTNVALDSVFYMRLHKGDIIIEINDRSIPGERPDLNNYLDELYANERRLDFYINRGVIKETISYFLLQ